ncbi:MAG TPA: hypothetical protein VKQ32_17915 [Polyangia bacterium]|nr:hypothetical protein [Polyangia bacterium]
MNRLIGIAGALAAIGLAACGGSLARPDAAGGTGGSTGGNGGSRWDAGSDLIDAISTVDAYYCNLGLVLPAPPVPGASCQYMIPIPSCLGADPSRIGVVVDGMEIPKDTSHANGWDYVDNEMTVQIYGPTCDALQSGSATSVVIAFKFPLP